MCHVSPTRRKYFEQHRKRNPMNRPVASAKKIILPQKMGKDVPASFFSVPHVRLAMKQDKKKHGNIVA